MKGNQGRKNPAQRVLDGLGGFGRRASGLILPGKALKSIEEAERKGAITQVFRERKQSGFSVVRETRRYSMTRRDPRRVANERHAASKRARVARRRNRV